MSSFQIQSLREKEFHWYIVRSLPHQEEKLVSILQGGQSIEKNILEVFCPVNTTVRVRRNGKDIKAPLYSGHVFVYATYEALSDFLKKWYPEVSILYSKTRYADDGDTRQVLPLMIPEAQMQAFREFNDAYDEQMVVLDRPYSDYAFNPKNGKLNEVVKILDGSFAGRRGYLVRFDGDRRLVFNILNEKNLPSLTVCIPNLWEFHVLRLQNVEDRQIGSATERDRAIDLLLGTIQACGKANDSLPALQEVVEFLCNITSWVKFCKFLNGVGERDMSQAFAEFSKEQVNLVYNLIRYERENPGYVQQSWSRNFFRPFLTPLLDESNANEGEEKVLANVLYEETIRRVNVEEHVYDPKTNEEKLLSTPYEAHVAMMKMNENKEEGKSVTKVICFANWDKFLAPYFLTGGKANKHLVDARKARQRNEKNKVTAEQLVESFRNYAPILYKVLRDADSPVKAKSNFYVDASRSLNVLYVEAENTPESIAEAKQVLIETGIKICQEIHSTTHLAVWRRYLCSVWLHV